MAAPLKATATKGEVAISDLADLVNGLLGIAYPYLVSQLVKPPWVFIPDTAQGTLFKIPELTYVSVQDRLNVRMTLHTERDGDLLGFPVVCIGRRIAFRVGIAHLTIGCTRERTRVLRPGTFAHFELVYRGDVPQYLNCLGRSQNILTVTATEEEARRLLPT